MSFFAEESEREPERPAPRRSAPWAAPPENEIGVAVPLRLLLGRGEYAALALLEIVAYSAGFSCRLALRVRPDAPEDLDPRAVMMQLHGGPFANPKERLRFGIAFADGRKTTNARLRRPAGAEQPPIQLAPRGGGGGGGLSWETGYWVYPLPPEGPITFAVAWPALGVDEQTREVDSAPIREAAARSEQLWPDERPVGGPAASPTSGWSSSATKSE